MSITCAPRLVLTALPGLPIVKPGDDLVGLIVAGLAEAQIELADGDVIVVTSKLISRAEGRFARVKEIEPSARAVELAQTAQKDPRLVELILRESDAISRVVPGVLVVRHRLGMTIANAGIDMSNVLPEGEATPGDFVLLLPLDPDASAASIRRGIMAATNEANIGVVVTDSHGRPFRLGTVGAAIGIAGMPALWDQRGQSDLFGRALQFTITALGDQIAAAADLVAGQAGEGRPVVHLRGLTFPPSEGRAAELVRPRELDLYF